MSEETTTPTTQVEEALALVQEAQSPKVFNLADLIKNRAYPAKTVTVYLDEVSAIEIYELRDRMYGSVDEAEVSDLEARISVLAEKIKESSISFNMRGISQDAVEKALEECNAMHGLAKNEDPSETPGWMRDYLTTLVGLNIESVVDSAGNLDDTKYDFKKADTLRRNIPSAEWNKLIETMQKLTLAGGYFDQLTDAGFLPKS